ncbi:bromodomain and WD repeat-containing DDB_G0285837-like, partial [Ruditapes philippinarum]|uniref:bromodomain and WD repeat-containing DDB_G0285837-like n=1 Tax=Ruditapes philippinarum TaxID=129788 RepID=UPI00295B56B4
MIASPCKDDDESDDEEDDDDDDDDYDDDDDILKDNKKHKSITKQSTKQPQAKKRKAVKEPIKPNKIRKTSTSPQKMKKTSSNPPVSQSFKIGKSKIPKHWKTAYVLMNTNDVPEDLTPDDFITVKALPIKKEHIELELPEESDEYNDLDSEDEVLDSDEDPGWSPEVEKSDDDILEDEPDLPDSDDESVEDSDEDPGWSPSKNKKQTEKRPKQFGLIGKQKTGHKSSPKSKQKSAPKTSLKSTTTVSQKKTLSEVKKTASTDKPAASSVSAVPANKQNRNVVITDNSPTGFVPEIGDFVLEKEECQDGNIPYLWRYKRGGLIQKYEQMEEDGKVFYQNVLSFSDWWACFAHRYQKVETQTLYRYKNLEKVEITKQPVIEPVPEIASSPAAPKGNSTQSTDNNNKETTNNKNKTTERMQEQEISSTTQDTGTDIPDRAFQIGQFVLDMKDKRNVDNFPIWKIESQILLKKYEPVFKNGRMRHRPVKT